jgi:hypothetical protein
VSVRTREDLGSFEDIRAAAVRTAGMDDFGGTEHEEGLRLLCADLAENGGLTPEGNYMQRTFIKSALVGRLLSEHGFKEHPSYAEVPIRRPIFVCGLPRTGTTALHRLLNADPAHQGLELWLTEVPQPRPPRDTWDQNPIYGALNAAFSEHHICASRASRSATSRWPTCRSTPPGWSSRTGPTPTSGTRPTCS